MKYQSIDDVFATNDRVRERLREVLVSLDETQCAARQEGQKWSIAEIAEHVAIVGSGMARICAKLLSKAEAAGTPSNGAFNIDDFTARMSEMTDVKLEAPDMVRPTGTRSIAESLASLDESSKTLRGLKPQFEQFDVTVATFPHPYFGELTAVEWLALYGMHEGRHLGQIRKILESSD